MRRRLWIALAILSVSAVPGYGAEVVRGLTPTATADLRLDAGLAVTYWPDTEFDLMRDMHQIVRQYPGEAGLPVTQLATGPSVLTTDRTQFVAAVLTGLIKFPEVGTYRVEFVSNDGILVDIAGRRIHADPNRHADTPSGPIRIAITTPGWYDLDIAYFQKKGTHRHDMYWVLPSAGGARTLVPPGAFAHATGSAPGITTMPVPDLTDTLIR